MSESETQEPSGRSSAPASIAKTTSKKTAPKKPVKRTKSQDDDSTISGEPLPTAKAQAASPVTKTNPSTALVAATDLLNADNRSPNSASAASKLAARSGSMLPASLSAPGVNLQSYISSVNQIPVLSREDEEELVERYYEHGDVAAARDLVLSHLRFVIHIARSYSGYGLPQGDLIQEGNVGLMKAVKRFDPTKGVRLVSFAVHWIKAEIHEYVIRNWRIVKIATTKAQRKLFFNLRSLKKSTSKLTLDEAQAIANDLDLTAEQVLEMESRLSSYDASFEAYGADDDDSAAYSPSLYLEAPDSDPAEAYEAEDTLSSRHETLAIAMQTLDARSQDILAQRWLAEKKATLHELADQYDISAERVRQLEKNAMEKIKAAMGAQ